MKPIVPPQERVLLDIASAAALLSISEPKLYRLIRAGDIRAVHVGAVKRVPRSELDAYAASLVRDAEALEHNSRLLLRRKGA